jgi:stage IV sporulation protein FB
MGQFQPPSYGDGSSPVSGPTVAHFRIGPIPVRIEFTFFLVTVLLGYTGGRRSAMFLLGWTVAVFISIMVHELGHAVVGRLYGGSTSIVLHGMGGLTFRIGGRHPSARQDILISLAGSATQIILLGIPAYLLTHNNPMLYFTSFGWYLFFWDLMWVSLGWGIINLLPILPLDGGNIAIALLGRTRTDDPETAARVLSVGTALALAIWMYNHVGWMGALWALFFAVWNAVPLVKSRI